MLDAPIPRGKNNMGHGRTNFRATNSPHNERRQLLLRGKPGYACQFAYLTPSHGAFEKEYK